jgi:pimeloyl-ACP methyl ester carboxylesterase
MTERFVDVPGGRLFVVDEGAPTDPAIVLLHACIADSRAWDTVAPLLVAGGHRVVRRDMRGFGRTETEDVEFSNRADVIAVLDALGIGQAALVGNSCGGRIAFDVAIESPDRVVAVVAIASGPGGFEATAPPEPSAEEAALIDEGDRLDAAFDEGGPDAPSAKTMADFDVRLWVDGAGQPSDRVPAAIRDLVREMDLLHYTPGRAQGQPIPLDPPAAERLADLRVPVLAIAGALDVSDLVPTALQLEAELPNATAVIWPDVAHMVGMEQPERLAGRILEFVAPLPRWS